MHHKSNLIKCIIGVMFVMFGGTLTAPAFVPTTPPARLVEIPMAPRAAPSALPADSTTAWRTAVQARPAQFNRLGALEFSRQILADPVQRGQAVGLFAETQYTQDNPAWRQVAKRNAPQNDLYTWQNGRFQGSQVKTFASGDPKKYWRAMQVDYRAEYFLVPDDHLPGLRTQIEQHAANLRSRGQFAEAARVEQQLDRVRGLGHSYAEYDAVMRNAARWKIRTAGIKAGGIGGGLTAGIEGGIVLYRAGNGLLTPTETVNGLADAAIKGSAVGAAVTMTVILGASPISLPVIAVGSGFYILTDRTVASLRRHTDSRPMTAEEIQAVLPSGWFAVDPGRYSGDY